MSMVKTEDEIYQISVFKFTRGMRISLCLTKIEKYIGFRNNDIP